VIFKLNDRSNVQNEVYNIVINIINRLMYILSPYDHMDDGVNKRISITFS
jgi:hypothetical protein